MFGTEVMTTLGDLGEFNCPYDLDSSHWMNPPDKYKGSFFEEDSKC